MLGVLCVAEDPDDMSLASWSVRSWGGTTSSFHCETQDEVSHMASRGSGGSFARVQFVSAGGSHDPFCVIGSGIQRSAHLPWRWPAWKFRLGEARHPGPSWTGVDDVFCIGTSNPSGLHGKEHVYGTLPEGIWGVAETHLSSAGMAPGLARLRQIGMAHDRHWRLHPGAPVPLRARSEIAGTWAGVMHISDWPGRSIHVPWPEGQYSAGRVALCHHWVGGLGVSGAVIYGWSPGPTWPQARWHTNRLLQQVTEHLVLRRGGCRYIMGDFNHDEDQLEAIQVWKSMGWIEVQTLHFERHCEPTRMTCKGKTKRDMIFVSPELAARFISASVVDSFSDHSVVWGTFQCQRHNVPHWIWPLPRAIDWTTVDVKGWQAQFASTSALQVDNLDGTQRFELWAKSFEGSLQGFVSSSAEGLHPGSTGRGSMLKPVLRPPQAPLSKPARHGEERLLSDLAGRGVQLWFRQLRRLQALVQSLRSGNHSGSAQAHRLETWVAICKASGFRNGFRSWWLGRQVQLQGSPAVLPAGVPTLDIAERLFADFNCNFRRYESWQLRRQQEISRAQLAAHKAKVFQRVRLHQKDYLDSLATTEETTIMAVSPDGSELHLEKAIGTGVHDSQIWLVDGMAEIQLERKEDDVFRVVDADCLLQPDQSIECQSFCTQVDTIQKVLLEFWSARWRKHATTQEADWQRILSFGKAFLPRRKLAYEAISLHAWQHVNARYNDRAARGPDGFHGRDLQHAPAGFQTALLDLLQAVELQQIQWPLQLLTGFVACLAKTATASEVAHFRPIIVFSAIYRSWSTARARPLLAHLADMAADTQLGFLPGREALQISFLVQGLIELCVGSNTDMQGLVTDIQKAFENIPRLPVFKLAMHIGAPQEIIQAWDQFLHGMVRRFVVRGEVGPPLDSTSGVPEGCAMSCYAMGIIDLCFHFYMHHFAPETVPLSFVDNLGLLSMEVAHLQRGQIVLQEFLHLWTLDMDLRKSWTWSTRASDKGALEVMGLDVKTSAGDLGVQHSYTGARRIEVQRARLASLNDLWVRLRKLGADDRLKYMVLQQAFWPRALHGVSVCLLGPSHIASLRTAAVKALAHGGAGASPLIRMSLIAPVKADPGFYQTVRVVTDFRRMAAKQEMVLDLWVQHFKGFDGVLRAGPFSKLLEVLEPLGWRMVMPPIVCNHHGVEIDLLGVPEPQLLLQLEDAWMDWISGEVSNRKDYAGLKLINWVVIRRAQRQLTGRQQAQVASLQEGAFCTAVQQSKYDNFTAALCPFCQVPDDLDHRCMVCTQLTSVHQKHAAIRARWHEMAVSQRHRLLPKKFPGWSRYQRALGPLGCPRFHFESTVPVDGWVDLFTDGSCMCPDMPECGLSTWAIVSSTHERTLSAGVVPGFCHSSDRAELVALLGALSWAQQHDGPTACWTDSAYTAVGIWRMQAWVHDSPYESNSDLWEIGGRLLQQLQHPFVVRHIPAHCDEKDCEGVVQAWAAHWNQLADRAAAAAYSCYSDEVRGLWFDLVRFQNAELHTLRALQELHCDIGSEWQRLTQLHKAAFREAEAVEEVTPVCLPRHTLDVDTFPDVLPSNWSGVAHMNELSFSFGHFGIQLIRLLMEHSDDAQPPCAVSWLELAFWCHRWFDGDLPVPGTRKGQWIPSKSSGGCLKSSQTLAAVVRLVRSCVRSYSVCFDFPSLDIRGIDLSAVGVGPPQTGLALRCSNQVRRRGLEDIKFFCDRRPIRVCNDLVRPLIVRAS